jgi:type IV secretory pathway VirB6-like protein
VYSITNLDVKHKTIKYNNENKNINTAQNDSKTICVSLKKINPNIKIESVTKSIDLIGDKGYITNDAHQYKNNIVNVVTPLKKNDKNKFVQRNNKKLAYRYIIKNTICSYKKDEIINVRKNRKIKNFMGFVYMSCLNHNLNVNKRMIGIEKATLEKK